MNIQNDGKALKAKIATAYPDAAYALISQLGSQLSMSAPIEALVAGPSDVIGLTIAGGLFYERGRRCRGGGLPMFVSRRGYELYAAALQDAASCLEQALRVDPEYGLAAAFLAGVRIEGSPAERDAAERAVLASKGAPAFAYFNVVFFRTAKWGGSQEAMWAAVRKYAGKSEPATLGLIARAHAEQQLFHLAFDDQPGAAALAGRYFGEREILDELRAVSERVLQSPHPVDAQNTRVADGWMAKGLIEAGQWPMATRHLKRLGRHADPTIWFRLPWASPRIILGWTRIQAGLLP